jgi:hypothetical protein
MSGWPDLGGHPDNQEDLNRFADRSSRCDEVFARVAPNGRRRLDGRLLAPGAFLPSAEQTALIHPLTDWVAREGERVGLRVVG